MSDVLASFSEDYYYAFREFKTMRNRFVRADGPGEVLAADLVRVVARLWAKVEAGSLAYTFVEGRIAQLTTMLDLVPKREEARFAVLHDLHELMRPIDGMVTNPDDPDHVFDTRSIARCPCKDCADEDPSR